MPKEKSRAGSFFSATLVLWIVSIWFEILFYRRSELLYVVFGALFYQSANWSVRALVSKDPLFVNTSVSLLHSTITSASGSFSFSFSILLRCLGGLMRLEFDVFFTSTRLPYCLILCLRVTSSAWLRFFLNGIRNFICTIRIKKD